MGDNGQQGKKVKNKNLNVKFPDEYYNELILIADKLGGMTLSGMIRSLVYTRLEAVRKSGNPRDFLDIGKDK